MLKVEFEDLLTVEDSLFKYAVTVCGHLGRWIYCKHRERETWEIPGGRREPGEAILCTARRELFEETGALSYALFPVCAYAVTSDAKRYGLLCYAEINALGPLPASEIERIGLFEMQPDALTYPEIQPHLFERIKEWLSQADRPANPPY